MTGTIARDNPSWFTSTVDPKALTRAALLVASLVCSPAAFAQVQPVQPLQRARPPQAPALEGAVLTDITGDVRISIAGETPRPVRAGEPIPVGAVITSNPNSSVVLAFPDGTIAALGEGTTLRLTSYQYVSNAAADPRSSQVSLNVIAGSVRFVMGDIAQQNPAAVRIQAGANTLNPTSGRDTDASVVVQGDRVAVAVQNGDATLSLPSGAAPQSITQGFAISVAQDGAVNRGSVEQVSKQLVGNAEGLEMQKALGILLSYDQKTLSAAAAAAQILRELENLPPTASGTPQQPAVQPTANTTPTAASGAAGGGGGSGTPCPASCN